MASIASRARPMRRRMRPTAKGYVAESGSGSRSRPYADCTGEFTVNVYDATGAVLLRTAYFDFFVDDNATELACIGRRASLNAGP